MRSIFVSILEHTSYTVAERILSVQHAAYRQEAAMLGVDRFPPLERSVSDIQRSDDRFFGARIDEQLIGVASIEPPRNQLPACISSMTVTLEYQRRGVARALMCALLREAGANAVTVSTAARNEPALALYAGFGFTVSSRRKIANANLEIVELRRDSSLDL
jgi:ribosomal protein S18 acetylase RimI-like enzyme